MKMKKKRVLSHRYKKSFSKSHSNCSLSQLLQIASFKKRINDLSRNNRLLTTALQESRIEASIQSNLLKDYAKDSNQILFARIKLNEMAKNLAKFATDLEEVRSYLDVSLPVECNFFQKKGSSNQRLIKVPDVSLVDEAPELSENDVLPYVTPDNDLHNNLDENTSFVNHDIVMTPTSLVDDVEEINKKRSCDADERLVTPKLDIDYLACTKQKRSTKSREKTPSLEKEDFTLEESVTHINDASPPLMYQGHDPVEINEVLKSSDVNSIEEESEKLNPFQNHSDELANISHNDCFEIQSSDVAIDSKKSIVSNDQTFQLNCSNILCENKSLNKEICPLQPPNNEKDSLFVACHKDNSGINSSVQEENKNFENDELFPENDSQKLSRNSSLLDDIQLPEISEYDEEIQNVGALTFCESDDEKKDAVSPFIKTSRSRKPVKYTKYFSSDESNDDSPFKLAVKKRSGSKKIKLSSTTNDNSHEKTSTEKVVEISSDATNEIPEIDYSVYDLDVSNSKRKGKKQKSKNKKTNDLSKPLFQKYSVTKLKAGKFKFSKCETSSELKSASTHLKKSLQNSCVSPGGILKKDRPSYCQMSEDKINEAENIDNMQGDKQQSILQTPKSESKRVSFAPTDLVCNFVRMSVSKTIADNKKIRRRSKSITDLKELFEEEDQTKTSPLSIDSSPEGVVAQKLDSTVLCNFSAETEMYTLPLPSNTHFPTDDVAFLESSVSIVLEQTKLANNRNDKHVEKSPRTLNSPQNTEKSFVKGNEIAHDITPQFTSAKAEMEDGIFLSKSPMSVVKCPERKSLLKEFSDIALKENIISDHPAHEKKDSLNNIIHANKNSPLSTHNVGIKKSSYSKSKVHSKMSLKKSKKSNPEIKSLEHSPVLTDATNQIASTDENRPRRRSKQVSYKEPNLMKKLRRC